MRKTLTALLLAATLPTFAMAMPSDAPRHGGHHGQYHHGAKALHDLDLSREQYREIGKIKGEQMQNRRAIHQRYLDKLPVADRQAMQNELQSSRDSAQKQIRAQLNKDQQKRFDEQQKKIEERRAERAEFEAWKAAKQQKAQ